MERGHLARFFFSRVFRSAVVHCFRECTTAPPEPLLNRNLVKFAIPKDKLKKNVDIKKSTWFSLLTSADIRRPFSG
jgi:hypothetical protein